MNLRNQAPPILRSIQELSTSSGDIWPSDGFIFNASNEVQVSLAIMCGLSSNCAKSLPRTGIWPAKSRSTTGRSPSCSTRCGSSWRRRMRQRNILSAISIRRTDLLDPRAKQQLDNMETSGGFPM